MKAKVPPGVKPTGKAVNPEKACAEFCGRSLKCKSWTLDHSTYQCYLLGPYMPGRKKKVGWTSGLPRRSVIKNVDVGDAQCCAAEEYWSKCGTAGTSKCAAGHDYLTWQWCLWPFKTNSKCRNRCPKKDYGCGCEAQAKCIYGDKPEGYKNFVRFCENKLDSRDKGRCCDQTGNGDHTFDLRYVAGCPRSSLSSVEVVGDCLLELFTEKHNGGAKYKFWEGRYNSGRETFKDGLNYAKITCN